VPDGGSTIAAGYYGFMLEHLNGQTKVFRSGFEESTMRFMGMIFL
jgi:hypothetical protein